MRLQPLIILLLLAFLLVGLFGYLTLQPFFNKPRLSAPGADFANSISADALPQVTFVNPNLGNPRAKVTIIEYGDYLCSFCATVQESLAQILKEYEDKVRLVWKDFPLVNIHPLSDKLASAARCAGEEGKFWEYQDLLFSRQKDILSEAEVFNFAQELRLGSDFETCYKTSKMRPRVQADFEEGVRLGVDGVPYFFVGNERLSGAVSYERLKETIEQQLLKVRTTN